MRAMTALAAVLLAGGALSPVPLWAQGNPTADQIMRSLTPNAQGGSTTRGIRAIPQSGPAAAGRAPVQAAVARAPSVSLSIEFASGSADLTPQARQTLDQLGKALSSAQLAQYSFRVEGHTDTVGSPAMNQMLSEKRAATVVGYLEGKFNIEPGRLHAVGMGEQGLLVPTPENTPEQRNRRVLVVNLGT